MRHIAAVVVVERFELFIEDVDDVSHEIVDIARPHLAIENCSNVDRHGESMEKATN
jgi:hypothetical protein